MDNKVGDNTPSIEVFEEFVTTLRTLLDQLKAFGVQLSSEERTRLSHPRHGAAPHVQAIIRLARSYGIDLEEVPLTGVEADYNLANRMEPLAEQTPVLDKLVSDTIGQAKSEYWQGILVYYGILSEMSKRIPSLEVELRPVREFMAKRRTATTPPRGGE